MNEKMKLLPFLYHLQAYVWSSFVVFEGYHFAELLSAHLHLTQYGNMLLLFCRATYIAVLRVNPTVRIIL